MDIRDQVPLLRDSSDIFCDSKTEAALYNEAISKCTKLLQLLSQQNKNIEKGGRNHK